ncbi:glycolate oxidase subunit GlcF [Consotaella aegiceratis]|uniref:glycolate oxidase subunit GlcF n=1 Tax=Consotaella aegiceratis TaxID=3097961 RepID=UPI002F4103F0
MQTSFSLSQLSDPDVAEAESILRKCVHCGFCLATCPTYVTLGSELDSPRGRIYLIKDMLENDRPAEPEVVTHLDRCLTCLSCMTTCPSGVDYMHLVEHGREHVEKTYRRPLADRAIRWLLARTLPYPKRFRAALSMARLARPIAGVFERVASLKPLAAMLRMAPARLPSSGDDRRSAVSAGPASGKRVALLRGCAQSVLDPGINAATVRLLIRLGVRVVDVEGEGCCGAIVQHMGEQKQGVALAKANIDAWCRALDEGGLDAIVITASGCGTAIKDYGHLFRLDPAYAEKAARVSALAMDVTEFLAGLDLPLPSIEPGLVVAYHSACSMQHGQRIVRQPKLLLANAGFVVRDVPEGHLCCGSAGTYNILQPEIAAKLRTRKVGAIESVAPQVVATGNIGCITQLAPSTDIPVLHTVELLDWALGGAKPDKLAARRTT